MQMHNATIYKNEQGFTDLDVRALALYTVEC